MGPLFGDVEPLFFFGEAGLDFADGLEVFVDFVFVCFCQVALGGFGVFEDGVEDGALLEEGGLAFGEGGVVLGEEAVEGGDGGVVGGDRFALAVPGEGEAGPVAGVVSALVAELDGGEAGVAPELFGGDLVGGDAVVKGLAGFGVAVGAGEPEGGAPVGFVVVLVGEVLDDGDVVFVFGEGLEAEGELVVAAGGLCVGVPGLLGGAEAHAEEGDAFGRGGGLGGAGESAEANGLEEGEGDEGGAAAQEVAAWLAEVARFGESSFHFLVRKALDWMRATMASRISPFLALARLRMRSRRASSEKPYLRPRAYSMRASAKLREKASSWAAMVSRRPK